MTPKIGYKIYIPTTRYLNRGNDDVVGGLATIIKIELNKYLPEDHFNYIMIGVEEVPGVMYNYRSLLKEQTELKKEFGSTKAHPDPDDREEFNNNDDWKP